MDTKEEEVTFILNNIGEYFDANCEHILTIASFIGILCLFGILPLIAQ